VPIGISGGIAGLYLLNLGGAHLDKLGLYRFRKPKLGEDKLSAT